MKKEQSLDFSARLIDFIRYKGISVRAFEIACGFGNAWVSDIKSQVDIRKIGKISETYPDLNIDWLFTGRGDMLYGTDDPTAYLTEDDLVKKADIPSINLNCNRNNVFITNWGDMKEVMKEAIRETLHK